MKKRLILICLISAVLFSCTVPVAEVKDTTATVPETTTTTAPTTKAVTVLNSFWDVLKTDTMARTITSTDAIVEEIDQHNSSTTVGQWFLYVGDYPDLEHAPPVNIYMCDKVTHAVISYSDGVGGTITLKWENWPRKQLVENRDGWQKQSDQWNAELYIDVIPPAPIIPVSTAEQLYAKYTINLITNSGKLQHVEHCTITFIPSDWVGFTLDDFFQKRLQAWKDEAAYNATGDDLPWYVEDGKVYTE